MRQEEQSIIVKKASQFDLKILKFPEGYPDCDTPEEVRRTQRSKNIVIRTTKMRTKSKS